MKYDSNLGIYYFDGDEDDIVFVHMWSCLTDLSFWGFVQTVARMIFKKPPKRYWEIKAFLKKQKGIAWTISSGSLR